ncbi:MAG: hypothetical protein HYX78_09030 [Armatimonadetes bacterium]|nr:hypothetical protein [Armatimonadota bacterium]
MRNIEALNNPFGDAKVISNCSIFGMMDRTGRRFSGRDISRAIANMHDRGNGLGGGLAVYGIYPEFADHYALHIMFTSAQGRKATEAILAANFQISRDEDLPTQPTAEIVNPPLVLRYFVKPTHSRLEGLSEDDFVVRKVMEINTSVEDSFVFSSGKNMGVFKGVGFPEQIAHYFCLEDYEGYLWTAHGRFPTNSQAWWGGAHPFSLLDWTVVHNGEISSYGINRRYLEMFGYHCTMHTDTEVITYAVDLLMRKQGLPVEIFADIVSAKLWTDIDRMDPESRQLRSALRQVYGSMLLNGPFSVIIAHEGEMIGLTDRVRLRPMVAAAAGPMLFLSSEEAAIRLVSPEVDRIWVPQGGEPVVGRLECTSEAPKSDQPLAA